MNGDARDAGGGELSDLVALVSGAAGGIGSVIIDTLTGAGARVAGLDRLPAPARPAEPGGAGRLEWIVADIRDDAAVERAVARVEESFGRLDIIVHAAGVARDGVAWKLPVEDWDLVHEVNLRGAFLLLRHGVPAMRRSGGGRVVLIGSINGSRGKFGQTAYASSKAGLIGLAKSAARETGRFGILVNVIEPGMVETGMTAGLPGEVRKTALSESLLGALPEPGDVAAAVLYLSGPGGRRITGQILRVDSGQYL